MRLYNLEVAETSSYRKIFDLFVDNMRNNIMLAQTHEPSVFDGEMTVFSASRGQPDRGAFLARSWEPFASGKVVVHSIDCTHNELLTVESVDEYGHELRRLFGGASD